MSAGYGEARGCRKGTGVVPVPSDGPRFEPERLEAKAQTETELPGAAESIGGLR